MSFRILQLDGLKVNIKKDNNELFFYFQNANIRKTMDDAEEKTLWAQDGKIKLTNVSDIQNLELLNYIIESIEISYDFYTYKNMLMLPFLKKGVIDLKIKFKNEDNIININCREIEIILKDNAKYIRHIKKTE